MIKPVIYRNGDATQWTLALEDENHEWITLAVRNSKEAAIRAGVAKLQALVVRAQKLSQAQGGDDE